MTDPVDRKRCTARRGQTDVADGRRRRRPSRSNSTISSTAFRKASARRLGAPRLRHRHRLRGLPALCRGMELSAEPGGARRPCRLPDPADLRPDRQLHRQEQCRPRAGLADRRRRLSVRALSVDLLCRSDRARRRSDPARSRGRHVARGADLRGHAAADGAGAAADVRRLSRSTGSSASICRRRSTIAATTSIRSSRICPTAPKAFTACRSTSRRPTSSCSSCSARSSNAPA